MTPDDVYALFIRDYLIMSYVASMGAIQLGASIGGLRGLFLLPGLAPTRLLGVLLVCGGIAWFFLAPLWNPGPWGSVAGGRVVIGAEGDAVPWGRALMHDLPQARNINDVNGGMSGNTQSLWFAVGAVSAILTTYTLGSIVNRRLRSTTAPPSIGMEALKDATFAAAIGRSLQYWRRMWRDELRSLGAPTWISGWRARRRERS